MIPKCSNDLEIRKKWYGFGLKGQRSRLGLRLGLTALPRGFELDRFLDRCKSLNYCSHTSSHIAELFDHFDVADQSLFKTVLSNSHHVLRRLLSKNKTLDLALTI